MKLLGIALAVVFSSVVFAQQPAPASLEGVVVQFDTKQPLSLVAVELRASWGVISATATEADGRFSFANVPPGQYRLSAARSGYVRANYGQRKLDEAGDNVVVRAGQQLTGLRIMMTPGGVVRGKVTRNGTPQALITVVAARISYDGGQRGLKTVLSTSTDDQGEYHLFWLPPGQYYIYTDRDSNRPLLPPPTLMIAPGGGDNPLISRGGNALVEMQRSSANTNFADVVPMRLTLSETEMYVPVFFPGTTDRRDATIVDVAPGSEVQNININVITAAALHVRGLVTGLPTNVQGQSVKPQILLFPADGPIGNAIVFPTGNQVQVDERGFFDIWRVRPGSYFLRAGAIVSGNLFLATASIDVRDRDVSVNLTLEPSFSIPGQLTIERQTALSPDPALVNLFIRPTMERVDGFAPGAVRPTANGSFTLGNVPPGDYRVAVRPVGLMPSFSNSPLVAAFRQERINQKLESAYVKSIRMGDVDVLNDGLHLTGPPNRPLVIVIGTDGGAIEGRVINYRRESVPQAIVVLVPENSLKFHVAHEFVTADALGKFEIKSIAPGDYKLYAWDSVDIGAWQDPEFLQKYQGQPVHIDSTAKATVDLISLP